MTAVSRRTFLGAAGAAGAATVLGSQLAGATPWSPGTTAYVGSYTSSSVAGHGLDVVGRTGDDPALSAVRTVTGIPDASWFDRSRDGRTLYMTNEGDPDGAVSALDIGDVANPKLLGSSPSQGAAPTHLSVHASQKFVLAANYGSGSVVVLPIEDGGQLGAATDLQQHTGKDRQAHAHQVVNDPSGKWVLSVDLGADSVYVYTLDVGTGKLALHKHVTLPTGAGPRHLAFHPDGKHAYLAQELRPEITVASWDSCNGEFIPHTVVPAVPPGSSGDLFPGEIAVSGDGKFVHATVRGPNTIATFTVDGSKLTLVSSVDTGGTWPRHLTLDADEQWFYVSNQRSGTITWLPRDASTGLPGKAAGSLAVPSVNSVFFA
ncbi:lactonase family protein [Amycolatopsis panacis]|uniref:Lactonase family protein n=1 Tax=Amycolatopsis panacis TaxID=2340917 RepID=A0A419I3Z2_9PSEU|nr:lactonase family protein [Amycolatopsis panacis]RJQ84981.1 lactonase family protein [Amycolatopsis panacis]